VRRRLALALAAAALAAGCGLVEAPPEAPAGNAPAVLPDAPAARGIAGVTVPTLSRDGYQRRAERVTVRVRNLSCQGVGTGSGFAVDASTLVTNRHVVAGADLLEVNTSDGRTLEVATAEVGVLGDVAFVGVDGTLPVAASLDGRAEPGSEIAAVGYPLGGPLTLSRGVVIDRIDGSRFDVPGPIVRISAEVQPGNSGGPLLDRQGRVAGVVYAIEIATGLGLAIPMDTVESLLAAGGTTTVPPCGSE
jgi:S1-C subfamily serine protease